MLRRTVPIEEYAKLAAKMAALKGKAVLTINDHPDMRKTFAAFEFDRDDVNYTISGAHQPYVATELVFRSW